jgi:hypothetical protein
VMGEQVPSSRVLAEIDATLVNEATPGKA